MLLTLTMATHCEQTQVSNNKLLPNTVTDRMRCSVNQGDLKVQPFLLWVEKIHLGACLGLITPDNLPGEMLKVLLI